MPTPNRGYVYPATSSPATVPADLRAPLEQVDADVQTLVDELGEVVSLNPDGTLPEAAEQQVEAIARENGTPPGSIPIFSTLAEAQAWELANPGRAALTIESQEPDVTSPTPGNLTASMTNVSATLTVAGDSDDRAVTGYSFRVGSALWSDWQAEPQYVAQGLDPSTQYEFQHRVRDAAGNTAMGTAVFGTTAAIAMMTPAEVGSLWAHWDASDTSTYTMNGAGVSTWTDVSGAARTLEQLATEQQPTTTALGGLTGIAFDRAAQQYMRHHKAASTRDATAGVTLCWVGRFDYADLAATQVVASIPGAAAVGRAATTAEIRNYVAPYVGAGDTLKPNAGDIVMLAVSVKDLGPTFAQVSDVAGDSNYSSVSDAGSSIVDIGRNAASGGGWSASTVGEFWIHDRALARSELDALNLYARGKWGAL